MLTLTSDARTVGHPDKEPPTANGDGAATAAACAKVRSPADSSSAARACDELVRRFCPDALRDRLREPGTVAALRAKFAAAECLGGSGGSHAGVDAVLRCREAELDVVRSGGGRALRPCAASLGAANGAGAGVEPSVAASTSRSDALWSRDGASQRGTGSATARCAMPAAPLRGLTVGTTSGESDSMIAGGVPLVPGWRASCGSGGASGDAVGSGRRSDTDTVCDRPRDSIRMLLPMPGDFASLLLALDSCSCPLPSRGRAPVCRGVGVAVHEWSSSSFPSLMTLNVRFCRPISAVIPARGGCGGVAAAARCVPRPLGVSLPLWSAARPRLATHAAGMACSRSISALDGSGALKSLWLRPMSALDLRVRDKDASLGLSCGAPSSSLVCRRPSA
jgi:hypothetical protein